MTTPDPSPAAPPPKELLLPGPTIRQIHATALATGLGSSRTALLGGIASSFVTNLPTVPDPSAQLLSDLHSMNAVKKLRDGTIPLATWLSNAISLTTSRTESDIFRCALADMNKLPSSFAKTTVFAAVGIVAVVGVAYIIFRSPENKASPPEPAPPATEKANPPIVPTGPTSTPSTTTSPTRQPVPLISHPPKDPLAPSATATLIGPTSGSASCQGTDCTLSLAGGTLSDSTLRVCLTAPKSAAALQGVQPVCTLRAKGSTSCFRSDIAAANVLLEPPITWSLCP